MKFATLTVASLIALSATAALAQGTGTQQQPGGGKSITGDPAASTATSGSANPMKSNPSGSGTSTSGGKDDNGDQGRDKMPESNMESGQKSGKR